MDAFNRNLAIQPDKIWLSFVNKNSLLLNLMSKYASVLVSSPELVFAKD